MADDTTAALIAQLDVKFDKLASSMKKAMTVFDDGGRKLERRQAQIKKNLSNWALDFSGLGGVNKALVGLTAGAVVGGLASLVKNGIDAAGAIGDVAQQAGVSVEFLQKMRFAATQSGASFDIMDTALSTLNKSLGDFVNTGGGKAAQTFKNLGIDKLIASGDIRNAEELFDALVKKLQSVGSEAQKSAYLAAAFGKEAGPKLLQLVNQGIDGIAKLEDQAVSLGIVLSSKTVTAAKDAGDKLDALFSVMKAQGMAAISSLAPEIASLAQEITDGLPDLITWVEKWATWFGLIQLSPVQRLKGEIQDINAQIAQLEGAKGSFLIDPFGLNTNVIDDKISALHDKVADLQAQLDGATKGQTPELQAINAQIVDIQQRLSKGTGSGLFVSAANSAAILQKQLDELLRKKAALEGQLPSESVTVTGYRPALRVNDIAAQAKADADAKAAQALADRREELLKQTGVDAATANAALIAAQNQTNVQLLKGSADYYAKVKKQIDDEYRTSVITAEAEAEKQIATLGKKGTAWKGYAEGVANINAALSDKIAAAAEKQKQALDAAGPSSFIRDALISGDQEIQLYKDETAALGLVAGAAAKLAYVQQQLNDAKQRGIPLTDQEIAKIKAEGDAIGAAAQANHDAAVKMQKSIDVADELRNGLEDVGVAGLHGFKSLKDAASQFLNQLAELIARLYVMQPLVEDFLHLGPPGTPLGGGGSAGSGLVHGESGGTPLGVWGSILGSIWPFAKGGVMTPNGPMALPRFASGGVSKGIGIFGEAGPEAAVPLPDGRRIPVDLRMPSLPSVPKASGNAQPIIFDLRGAVVTQDLIDQMNTISRQNSQQAVAIYDRNILPGRVQTLNKFPRRRH
jgi:hypothetical protein